MRYEAPAPPRKAPSVPNSSGLPYVPAGMAAWDEARTSCSLRPVTATWAASSASGWAAAGPRPPVEAHTGATRTVSPRGRPRWTAPHVTPAVRASGQPPMAPLTFAAHCQGAAVPPGSELKYSQPATPPNDGYLAVSAPRVLSSVPVST